MTRRNLIGTFLLLACIATAAYVGWRVNMRHESAVEAGKAPEAPSTLTGGVKVWDHWVSLPSGQMARITGKQGQIAVSILYSDEEKPRVIAQEVRCGPVQEIRVSEDGRYVFVHSAGDGKSRRGWICQFDLHERKVVISAAGSR